MTLRLGVQTYACFLRSSGVQEFGSSDVCLFFKECRGLTPNTSLFSIPLYLPLSKRENSLHSGPSP